MAESARVTQVRQAAIAQGLLPQDAAVADQDARPWPVLLLTALGAWLAAVPLLVVIGMLLGDVLQRSIGPYMAGLLLLAGALVVLRAKGVPIFVEQLALPALVTGGGALGIGLFRDLPVQAAAAVLCAVALGVAGAVPRAWLRNLLGLVAATLAVAALLPPASWRGSDPPLVAGWFALHGALAAWCVAMVAQRRMTNADHAPAAALIESCGAGWLLAVVAGLAAWSGMTFLVGGAAGIAGEIAREAMGTARAPRLFLGTGSAALALGAALIVARAWPGVRSGPAALAALVLAALAWFMPTLGGVLLALALAATSQRWLLAGAAALASAWIAGSFYYQLTWTLASKALVLVAAGVALGLLAWWAGRRDAAQGTARPGFSLQGGAALVALALIATLGVANWSIWDKERLIAQGRKVFVRLAPVDPRSLMQGDYMRVNYQLPGEPPREMLGARRPFVVARIDERGVANLVRVVAHEEAAGPGELRIELTPKDGRWTLVTDAWFFAEGDARRWEGARYGEFRVMADGRALLVGLADDQLHSIPIAP